MRVLIFNLLLVLSVLPAFSHAEEELPVVGFDKNRQETTVVLSKDKYARMFRKMLTDVNDSTLPVLRKQKARPGWMLRDVAVGLGVSASAGLGPIYSVSAKPRVILIYSNSTTPQYP